MEKLSGSNEERATLLTAHVKLEENIYELTRVYNRSVELKERIDRTHDHPKEANEPPVQLVSDHKDIVEMFYSVNDKIGRMSINIEDNINYVISRIE